MRVYLDRRHTNTVLRTAGRRGRSPEQIAAAAGKLLEKVARAHSGATSCVTFYEVEEALYRSLAQSAKGVSRADAFLIPAARSVAAQVQIVVQLFNLFVLDFTAATTRLQLAFW